MRAMLISLIDQVEDSCVFLDFMKQMDFISETYDGIDGVEGVKDKCKKQD